MEAVLVASLLAFVMLGVVDVGRLLSAYVAVQDAAQEGALYAAFDPDGARVQQLVRDSTDDWGLGTSVVSMTCGSGDVDVVVNKNVDVIHPLIASLIGEELTLTRTITARIVTEESCVASP